MKSDLMPKKRAMKMETAKSRSKGDHEYHGLGSIKGGTSRFRHWSWSGDKKEALVSLYFL
jgi:hypothetical protein